MGVMYYRQDDGTYVPIGGPHDYLFTGYTPTISQGASSNIAKTVNYSRYVKLGRLVIWNLVLATTGTGTAGSSVRLTLPVTAAFADGQSGSGYIYDASLATVSHGGWYGAGNTTQVQLVGDWAGNSAWGATPNVALASGDYIIGHIVYEAAS